MRIGHGPWVLMLAALAACGSSSGGTTPGDLAAAYLGVWTGTITSTVGSTSNTRSGAKLPIEEIRPNQIKLHGYCSGTDAYGEGPTATVTASGLTIVPLKCTYASTTCPAVTADIKSGNGSLSSGLAATLTIAITAVVTDCGGTGTDLVTFTSSQRGPYGSSLPGAPTEEDRAASAAR